MGKIIAIIVVLIGLVGAILFAKGTFTRPNDTELAKLAKNVWIYRSRIHLYRLQHNKQDPNFRRLGWKALTQRSDINGNSPEAGSDPHLDVFGPYIPSDPLNPITNSGELYVTAEKSSPDFKAPSGYGFVYFENSDYIWAVERDGTLFNDQAFRDR